MSARAPWFEALVYGYGGGVMFEIRERGESALAVATAVAKRYSGYAQAESVGAWSQLRNSPPVHVLISEVENSQPRGET